MEIGSALAFLGDDYFWEKFEEFASVNRESFGKTNSSSISTFARDAKISRAEAVDIVLLSVYCDNYGIECEAVINLLVNITRKMNSLRESVFYSDTY